VLAADQEVYYFDLLEIIKFRITEMDSQVERFDD
jgi:hypothetical protein